jgi:hypothetical protein
MVNKSKVNTVTINGKPYSLTAKIAVGNLSKLRSANNRYIANNIYGIATVGNIVNKKAYPNTRVASAIKTSALAKAGVTLNSLVFSKTGLSYFLKAGNITITS